MKLSLKKFGPGFIFAGAAIGVSHLVQSTRAGADFGFGLLWALLLINAVKYPFFQFGPRYASATGESLLEGYRKMGKSVIYIYFVLTFATMFTIQTAVTIVTAGIATSLFGFGTPVLWTAVITVICFTILVIGRYKLLDSLMKIIVIGLTISTLIAVVFAVDPGAITSFDPILPTETAAVAFLIAFMGWMPAPLDISIWHSIWTVEKKKLNPSIKPDQSRFDFNVGYITTTALAIGFLALGALVMFGANESFSLNSGVFANQLISMYTQSLGDWAKMLIGIAALTTMFSTTLTTLDGSPRVMHKTQEIIFGKQLKKGYLYWLLILAGGTLIIFFLLLSEMKLLVEIATILSFLTAPFYAFFNYRLISGKHTPVDARPGNFLKFYSVVSIFILVGFSTWYLSTLL
ncbi:MAG: Nramp family divalent metal transporter [Bacteroidia bacterium]|nr:Nramp family divalent metal transporter [Bacteroidia bacterium]MBT8276460.1 Nramp family divalent metal transporter [Bacteroidia bacterium]NNF30384.1 Nramp family divalent metal transporter [Flavobacteriaceae bacterium]NNK53471.1 Nramp family divalent metal transporter [Flavobacteriaceae bacterium]NNM08745.1 Nramp family divalent metal transporter [Flavobacteriaceae bacterium]